MDILYKRRHVEYHDSLNANVGRGQVEKVDLLGYFWKIDLEKIYFFDLYLNVQVRAK